MVEITNQQWRVATAGGARPVARAVNWRLLIAIGVNTIAWSTIIAAARIALS